MPTVIPEKFQDLLEKKIFVSLATLMPDGRPQVTPTCKCRGGWWRSPRAARINTSTSWRRSTWTRISIRSASRAKCG